MRRAMVAGVFMALAFVGCAIPASMEAGARARNAANTAEYTAALDECISKSLDYKAYQTCAADVDFRFAVADAQTSK